MFDFDVMYSLETLTKNMDLVQERKEKEKVVIRGTSEYSSFFAVFSYLKTIEGTDWFQLAQYQQARLQEQLTT